MTNAAIGSSSLAIGDLVVGSDFNAASSLLYRWWGLFEAPPSIDITPFFEDLFDDEVETSLLGPNLKGAHTLKEAITSSVKRSSRSHHLEDKDIRLTFLGDALYRLEADFTYQIQTPYTELKSGRASYRHTLKKRADDRMVFTEIDGKAGDAVEMTEFKSSYVTNRAKAIIIQFQTQMDALSGDASGLQELMMPKMELHGLVSSKTDDSEAKEETVTDLSDLKKTIAGKGQVKNNIIRDFDELAAWFATGPSLFKYGHHRLEKFSATPLSGNRYEVMAQFDWRAETVNGAKIELHQPLTWILVDRGEKYMRIEKLLPPM